MVKLNSRKDKRQLTFRLKSGGHDKTFRESRCDFFFPFSENIAFRDS